MDGWQLLGLLRVGGVLAPEALHDPAPANLRERTPPDLAAGLLRGEGSASQVGGGCDAARLLLVPELLPEGGEVIALAPHVDMLVLRRQAQRRSSIPCAPPSPPYRRTATSPCWTRPSA